MASICQFDEHRYNIFLEEVLTIFKSRSHPFVLLDNLAMCWMGSNNLPNNGFYILVRPSQLEGIVADLTATGNWERHEIEGMNSSQHLDSGIDIVLQCLDHSVPWDFIRLVPEDLYFLSVDGPTVEVPDLMAGNSVLIESEYHPDKKNFRYGPYSMSPVDARIPPSNCPRATCLEFPILIPTIEAYLNALFDQSREYEGCKGLRREICAAANWNIRNFIRYLFLDLPHQRALILSRLNLRNRGVMEDRLDRYRRKFSMIMDPKTREIRTNIPWVTAYPEGQDF